MNAGGCDPGFTCGGSPNNPVCVPSDADIAISNVTDIPSTNYDPQTFEFSDNQLLVEIENRGPADIAAGTQIPYTITDQSQAAVGGGVITTNATLGAGSRESHTLNVSGAYSTGVYPLTVTLDPQGSLSNTIDSDNSNNSRSVNLELALMNPETMEVDFSLDVITNGSNAEVNVLVESTNFDVNCELSGPLLQDFALTPGTVGPILVEGVITNINAGPAGGFDETFLAGPLESTGTYMLSCIEPTTGTTFETVTDRVDVLPEMMEI
jgi:hypothetical protein